MFGPAGHLAKGGIHIGDLALQVHGPHAREDGVFHGASEIGLGYQGLLGLQATAGVPPATDQHPGGEHAQGAHQPKQAIANQALRGAVGLRAQDQTVAHGRDGH